MHTMHTFIHTYTRLDATKVLHDVYGRAAPGRYAGRAVGDMPPLAPFHEPHAVEVEQGMLVLFPSWLLHEVEGSPGVCYSHRTQTKKLSEDRININNLEYYFIDHDCLNHNHTWRTQELVWDSCVFTNWSALAC